MFVIAVILGFAAVFMVPVSIVIGFFDPNLAAKIMIVTLIVATLSWGLFRHEGVYDSGEAIIAIDEKIDSKSA